ncbi:nucleotide triphosphate diphosphatase NUDT15 [Thiothrix eikelboomii]|uniref:nucleotide triphosphate diphosphatase NUDT15 n=1 Tax=Thiothrix eikelboomii TaxID=92487 RepID=UPI003BAF44C8
MEYLRAGVGVIIANEEKKILICKRKAKLGFGTYSIPGGNIELGEKIISAAVREVFEETGLEVKNLVFLGITNNIDIYKIGHSHSISIIFYTNEYIGTVELKEPNKHESWSWYLPSEIPEPHFEPSKLATNLLNKYLLNENKKFIEE